MELFSIDLSLRSSGTAYFKNGVLEDFCLICRDEDAEELVIANTKDILEFISNKQLTGTPLVVIEGLSFNSNSGAKDVIAGQFWYLRCELVKLYPNVKIVIVPVKSWRSPLFNKEENKILREAAKDYKANKLPVKGLKGEARKEAIANNQAYEIKASIKEATWKKLDPEKQKRILDYIEKNSYNQTSKYDITDSLLMGEFYLRSKK